MNRTVCQLVDWMFYRGISGGVLIDADMTHLEMVIADFIILVHHLGEDYQGITNKQMGNVPRELLIDACRTP